MSIDDQVLSLTRKEVQVLYWRCRGKLNKEISLRYGKTSDKWAEGVMTGVYVKLGVDKKTTKLERLDYLNNEIFRVVQRLLEGNEDNLERWPLYGVRGSVKRKGVIMYAEQERDDTPPPDPKVMALVLNDQDEAGKHPPDQGNDEYVYGRPVDWDEIKNETEQADYARREREWEERKRREEEELERKKKEWEEWKRKEEDELNKKKINAKKPRLPSGQRRSRIIPFGVTELIGIVICLVVAGLFWRTVTNQVSPSSTFTPAISASQTDSIIPSSAIPETTSAPENTSTPQSTSTPTIPPTAIPLPISEDFSGPLGQQWQSFGNVIITESVQYGKFSGVFATQREDTATIRTGNEAWSDYIITTRIYMQGATIDSYIIGVRSKDINNYIGLECSWVAICSWIAVEDGKKELITGTNPVDTDPLIVTVKGNEILVVGDIYYNEPTRASLVIPEKYRDQYQTGGVLLKISSLTEVDYLQIESN